MKGRSGVDLIAVSEPFGIRRRKETETMQIRVATGNCTEEHSQHDNGL